MRILITGGAGFIGSNLVHELLQDSGKVERIINLDALTYCGNLDNLVEFKNDARHVFVHGSITDTALVESLLQDHQIQAVMNLAAETHVDRSIDSPEPFVQTNVLGTLHLLEASRKYWSALGEKNRADFRFHHISTDEVFGSLALNDPPFCETTSYDPRSPYSASKASSDHLVRAYFHTYGLPTLITNCSNNYGPRQFPEKLIPLLILNALEGRQLPVYGDGQQRRDWLYVTDHCRALALVLSQGRPGETYTIGGEAEKPNLEIVHSICTILDQLAPRSDGRSYAQSITHVADRPGHDRRYAISIEKIKNELGWTPQESLTSGLRKTVEWYLKNRAWSEAIAKKSYAGQRLGTSKL